MPANTNVAFGRADRFTFRNLSGSFVCSEATFGPGSKVTGGVNECSVPSGTSTPPPTNPPPPSNPPPSPDLGYYPGCAMPTNTEVVQFTATRVVGAGQVFDGQNKVYNLSGGSQSEGQPAVFDVQEGGTVRNVIIGTLAADGIHCLGNCTLDHVWWQDIGEDAATALGVEFNTPNCQVSQADVTLMPPSQMNTSACAGSCPAP